MATCSIQRGDQLQEQKLHVLRVGDRADGHVIFHWSRNDGGFLIDGLERVPMTSSFPRKMRVTRTRKCFSIQPAARGYEDWIYRKSEGKQQTRLLKLEPGQTMQLTIKMRREKK
jgi:hypothetical protein